MGRLLCPKCGKKMYVMGIDIDPSAGLQSTEMQCFSLDPHHRIGIVEPIPEWEEFRKERKVEIHPNGKRMTPYKRKKILTMLAQGIPYPKIAKATGFSTPIICRLKQITMLATISIVINNLNYERRVL